MSDSRSTVLAVAAVVATGVLAYAVYFDYKRRNDAEFRRKLKKEKKRVNKAAAQSQAAEQAATTISPAMLREALEAIKNEAPIALEQREGYFMSQVSMGEQLASQGPASHLPAAIAFYRALRIYPAPAELIGIYEGTVPPPVFKLVIEMTNMDVTARVQGYLEVFPPKSMSVSIKTGESVAQKGGRFVLVANHDFAAGETIYKEHPVVSVLDQDLQAAGTHCTHCFRPLKAGSSIKDEEASVIFPSVYCSQPCLAASKSTSNGLLFTGQSPLPESLLAGPISDLGQGERKEAQTKFAQYVASEKRNNPLLAARFIARQVVNETAKLAAVAGSPMTGVAKDYPDAEEGEYTLADHTERWRHIDVSTPDQELPLLSGLLKATLPGLEAFTTETQYATLAGKMAYNAFGVCFDGGREDRPASNARPEDVEKSRTPVGTDRQVGSAIYNVSAYLTHSCTPNARTSFTDTNELNLIASKPIKAGDVLTIAFVDVTQKQGESVAECKRRRRVELVRGWKFACVCEQCEAEADEIKSAALAAAAVPGMAEVATPGEAATEAEVSASTEAVTEVAAQVETAVPAVAADATDAALAETVEEAAAAVEEKIEEEAAAVAEEKVEEAVATTAEEVVADVVAAAAEEAEPVGDIDGSKVEDVVKNFEANPPAPLPPRGDVE